MNKLDEKVMNLNIVVEEGTKYVKEELERNILKENRKKLLEKFKNLKKKS